MNEEQILETIKNLGKSQGSYQRFYGTLMQMKQFNPDDYKMLMDGLVNEQLKDEVDLILYLEG